MSSVTHLHKPVRQVDGFSLYFHDDIAIIVIDRGENRFDNNFFEVFNAFLDDVERNETCKGLVTTGIGRFYSNGINLNWVATLAKKETQLFFLNFITFLKRFLLFPLPTLAAINGHAFAGGAILALAHDLRIMNSQKGWLCLNEVFMGLPFTPFLSQIIREKLGHNSPDAMVLGKRYTAQDAFAKNMIHGLMPPSLLLIQAPKYLFSVGGKTGYPRQSMADMKTDTYQRTVKVYEEDAEELKSKL